MTPATTEPAWVTHSVWWHVYPLGFVGAEPTSDGAAAVVHRLDRLVPWLDYAVDLGASGLALGPVFASRSHGYDTVDYLRVDPRLGDERDLVAVFDAAHERGLRVMLDGVFNHVGRGHPAFRAVVDEGPGAGTASWFRLSWPDSWRPGDEPGYATFEGHGDLVALNHDEPAVADLVTRVMTHWLDLGADAWRLDAAYAVPPGFWRAVLPSVRAAHPDVYVVGEVIHGDYPGIVEESGMDAVTQYELWKATWSALNDTNLFELAWALDRHGEFLDVFVPFTFVGNHDVTRIASRLADARHVPHALAVLCTVGGTPSVYYGDEQAFRGVKEERFGGDDAIRPAFPADRSGLPPEGWDTYRLHQELIGLRRRHPWLHRARTEVLHLANAELVYAASGDGGRLVVVLNLGDATAALPAPGADRLLAGRADVAAAGTPDARATVEAHGWAVLSG